MSTISRRALARGAAWSLPVVAVASAVPAMASSCLGNPTTWYAKSRIVYTDPDYSQQNFDSTVTVGTSSPRGYLQIQHWYASGKLYWRLQVGFADAVAEGATVRLPIDPSWSNPSTPTQYGLQSFFRFRGRPLTAFSQDLPTATLTTTATEMLFTFDGAIPAGSAGGFGGWSADPVGGDAAVQRGDTYTAEAFVNFTPDLCAASATSTTGSSGSSSG